MWHKKETWLKLWGLGLITMPPNLWPPGLGGPSKLSGTPLGANYL